MFKILVFLFTIFELQKLKSARHYSQPDQVYIPPSNTKHPYGDEVQFNWNMLDYNTNPFPCEEVKGLEKRLGKCPVDLSKEKFLLTPYVECPDYAIIPSPDDLTLLPNPKPNTEVLCKRCDVKLNTDGASVLLECYHCMDVPSISRVATTIARDIQFKVFFVQISNYSSVEPTGTEYFNP